MATKLIFLDIDGVVNTTDDHRKMKGKYFWTRPDLVDHVASIIVQTDARVVLSSTWRFSPEMTEYVKQEISKALQRKRYKNMGRVEDADIEPHLSLYDDVLISVTPDLSRPAYDPSPLPENSHQTRTDEIILWLKENAEFNMDVLIKKGCPEHSRKCAALGDIEVDLWTLPRKLQVANFICLDDMNLSYFSCYRMRSKIKEHLILTKTSSGMSSKLAKEAVRTLNDESFDINEWASECFVACQKPKCFHAQIKQEKKMIDEVKRSSLNLNLEILPARSKTAPSSMMEMQIDRSVKKEEPKKRHSAEPKMSDGFDCLL